MDSALDMAVRKAPNLFFTSCSSLSSTLDATIPAPAWKCNTLSLLKNDRIVIAWTNDPSKPAKPIEPP